MDQSTNEISAQALLYRLRSGEAPLILDVRTEEDFGEWHIECMSHPEEINIPYIEFIEEPETMIAKLPKDREIVVICGKGGASAYVADILRNHGFTAWNIAGGMKAWGSLYRSAVVWEEGNSRIIQFNRVGKGCLSYLIVSGSEAAIIDPARHVDQYISYLVTNSYQLKYIIDTHLHADHLSGANSLRKATQANYLISSSDMGGAKIDYEPLRNRQSFKLGNLEFDIIAISSPGHTPGSSCVMLKDKFIFTGDTLFLSSMGRPDLGGKAEAWVKDLWKSVRSLEKISDETIVFPSHTAGVNEFDSEGKVYKTLGDLRKDNELLSMDDEEIFGKEVLANLPKEPDTYQKMRLANLGVSDPSDDDKDQWELGRNRCAIEASKHASVG